MEFYRRKEVGEDIDEPPKQNEIIVTTNGKIKDYVEAVLKFFETGNEVEIRGKGKSINKAVSVVEIVKRKLPGKITQNTTISSVPAIDIWEPTEENLD
ncbi:hypothetical protein HK096_007733, partial [Nowakowskiella sp. JEL0078]